MISQLLSYDHMTLFLYFGIVSVSSILAIFSQRNLSGIYAYGMVKRVPYILSFINTSFFATFSAVGADRPNYIDIFETVTFDRILHGSEPGFELLQYVIFQITRNPEVFISVVSLWTVYNIYRGLWKFREDISLGIAVFLFTSQYYFQSFSLIRIYFASSILIRFAYLIREGKYIRYAVTIFIVCTIHYSTLFALIAYVLSFVFLKSHQLSGFKFYVLIILAIVFSIFGTDLIGMLLNFSGSAMVNKYAQFLSGINVNKLGFKWIFNVIPYILIFSFRKVFAENQRKYIAMTMAYLIIAMSISLMSYSVPVIGRGLIVLNMPILIILPLGIGMYRKYRMINSSNGILLGTRKVGIRMSYRGIKALCYLWGLVSLVVYLSGYMPIDKIDNYMFLWGKK